MKRIINFWQSDYSVSPNISTIHVTPPCEGSFIPLPEDFDRNLIEILQREGINALYRHQWEAIQSITQSNHTIITTGPASGKSLCYMLPILERCLNNDHATALLLFPTKALTQDQYKNFLRLAPPVCTLLYQYMTAIRHLLKGLKYVRTPEFYSAIPICYTPPSCPIIPNGRNFFEG